MDVIKTARESGFVVLIEGRSGWINVRASAGLKKR